MLLMVCFFVLYFVDFLFQLYFFKLLNLSESLSERGDGLNYFVEVIIFRSVSVFSIGLVHFMARMGGSQAVIEGKFLLNPSMWTIENGVEIFGYLEVHLEINFVINIVKEVFVVVKWIHFVDTPFAFTHKKVDLLSLSLAQLVFTELNKFKKWVLHDFEVDLKIPEHLKIEVDDILMVRIESAHLMEIAVEFKYVGN